jgi:hypothetical protein
MMTAKVKIPRTRCPAALSPGLGGIKPITISAVTPMANHASFDFTIGFADFCKMIAG